MGRWRVFLLPGAALLLFLPLQALDPQQDIRQYLIDAWQTEHGLPQNSVLTIHQARDGYVWLGTFSGLARFDGVQFVRFTRGNTPQLHSNSIQTVYEDSRGTLWIGSISGGLLRYRSGTFRGFSIRDGLPSDVVVSIHEDQAGTLWVGTDQGLCRMANGRFVTVASGSPWKDNFIYALSDDGEGGLWIGCRSGLFRLFAGEIVPVALPGPDPAPTVWTLCRDRRGVLWAGTDGAGLFRRERGRIERFAASNASPSPKIRALFEDRRGVMWLGTDGDGLQCIRGDRLLALTTRDGLSNDFIFSIAEDHEGSLWVGTYRNGLNRLRDGKFQFYSSRHGLPVDPCRSVLGGRNGDVWVGTVGGGVARFHGGGIDVFGPDRGLSNGRVWSLCERRDGTLLAGTYGSGLFRLAHGRFVPLDIGVPGSRTFVVRALYEDRHGRLWVGTNGHGLFRVQGKRADRFHTGNGLSNDVIYSIAGDSRGIVWAGTYGGGLNRIEGDSVRTYTTRDGLSNDFVWTIFVDRRDTLWIGTSGGGISRFRDGAFTVFTERDGLASDTAFSILEDRKGYLWMTANDGVFRVRKRELEEFAAGRKQRVTSYTLGQAEGIKNSGSDGPAQPAGWLTADHRLWYPTSRGMEVINPEVRVTNFLQPPVVVEQFLANEQQVETAGVPSLPPGSRRFELHYTALSLLIPERVRFRIRLEGFDNEWRDVGTRRVAYYSNLAPGRYVFRVIACNNDGIWNLEGARLEFVLKPRFHQTRWFAVLLALPAGAVLLGAVNLRTRGLRAQEKKLSGLVEQRTAELLEANRLLGEANQTLEERGRQLQKANQMLERLSHIDALTGIANRRYFEKSLELEWRRARRNKSPFAMLMIDVDFFKNYNDHYGHPAGDKCLQAISQAMAFLKRSGDLASRYGGEEFCVILPETDEVGAGHIADRIRDHVAEMAIPHARSSVSPVVTVSIGIAAGIPGPKDDASDLVAAADQALYQAKQAGRNSVRFIPFQGTPGN